MSQKSAALVNAAAQFAQIGLPFPFVPQELQPGFRQLGDWLFGTRDDVGDLTSMGWFAKEVAIKSTTDYVMVGRGGHGMQSTALCYYLVSGPLAVFIQSSWGAVYTDEQVDIARIERRFALAQRLYVAAQDARSIRHIKPGERFIVMDSDFSGGSWIHIAGLMEEDAFIRSPDWRTEKNVLAHVLAMLRS